LSFLAHIIKQSKFLLEAQYGTLPNVLTEEELTEAEEARELQLDEFYAGIN
jgi:hypothetical protein